MEENSLGLFFLWNLRFVLLCLSSVNPMARMTFPDQEEQKGEASGRPLKNYQKRQNVTLGKRSQEHQTVFILYTQSD